MQGMETSGPLILQSTFLTEGLAAAMAMLTAPLLTDLAVCIAGNLRRGRKAGAAKVREIRLAVVVPAHDEEAMIERTVRSLLACGLLAQLIALRGRVRCERHGAFR